MSTQAVHPEYLISQLTHTCLTVVSGTGIDDAVIGMANCNGSAKQQWFPRDGLWQWGVDQSLCLFRSDDEKGQLCLAACDSILELWVLDEDMRLTLGTQALTVSGEAAQRQVSLKKKDSKVNQKWWTLSMLETSMEGNYLAGEHSLTPPLLDMCKKEIDKSAARRTKNQRHQMLDLCQGDDLIAISCESEVICSEEWTAIPEYLINQNTLTCLTVMGSNDPADASIELSPFTGGINQQWFVNGKVWHWAGNSSYCLWANEKKGIVKLDKVKRKITSWNFDKTGFMKTKSKVLQSSLEYPQTQVSLAAKSDDQNKKWWKLSKVMAELKATQGAETGYPEPLVKMIEEISLENAKCSTSLDEEDDIANFLHAEQGILTEEKEYLVSQSTHACLTVLSESGEAVVGLAPYDGNSNQQWLVRDGVWHWGHNSSLHLAPDFEASCLRLAPNGDVNPKWDLNKEGFFMNGSCAVGIAEENEPTKLSLQPKLGGKLQRWWTLTRLKSYVGLQLYPLPVDDKQTYKLEVERGIINGLSPLTKPLPHPRDVSHYPGTVPASVSRSNFSCVLNVCSVRQPENTHIKLPKDWQATNMYVAAGDIFIIVLPDNLPENQARQIFVKVGAHTDRLKPTLRKIKNQGFKRMPVVTEDFDVNPGINFLRSQYGGNLIFTYEGDENITVTAEMQNVIETPHYILGKTNEEEWERMRNLDTPFSVLESHRVVLVVSTSKATKIPNPEVLLQRYDDIIEKIEDLSGFSEKDPPTQGKQWLVDDIQITAGSAHAGFPIMFQRQLNDLTLIETPYSWVVWHEIGHNYQQKHFWSHAYGTESTVNLFSLYIQEQLHGDDRLKRQNKYKVVSRAVDDGLTFERADCWQKLVFMMEIKHAFPEHGWEVFRHLNRVTRALQQEEADSIKTSRQMQFDHAYMTMSKFIGSDLIHHYKRWSVPVSEKAQKEIESLGLPKSPSNLSIYCP